MLNKRRGQSTVEYIVLVSAVIAVAIAFFLAPNNQFSKTMNSTLGQATSQISNMQGRLVNGQPLTTGASPAPAVNTGITAGFCTGTQRLLPTGLCG